MEHDRPAHKILKLANIAGPALLFKHGQLRWPQAIKDLAFFLCEALKKRLRQRADIAFSLSKRGHMYRDDSKPVKQVFPKASFEDFAYRIAVRGAYNADIHFLDPVGSNPLNRPCLQKAQYFDLQGQGHFADFI